MNAASIFAVTALAAVPSAVLATLLAREKRTQVALRQELSEAATKLSERQQLDTIKDEFISTVSHELRTPLTSIRGALGLLSAGLMGQMDAKAANLLRIASTNTDRLVRLINDILDLERMDSGRAPMQLRPCSLRDLIAHSADTMNAMAQENGVRIDILPEPGGMPAAFEADPDRIQQVLVNLLSNAIKFSPRGASILIASSFDAQTLGFRIEDSGRGVPAEKLESIFGRFTQVENSDARQKGGTGLGLAICRSILAQHNGTITARRNDADGSGRVGTTFTVTFPRSLASEQTASLLQPATAGPILVCDDDADVRRRVAEHLRQNGYAALESAGGDQALTLAASQPVEAILMDLRMSGWDVIDRLKRDERTAHIPVVVLSMLPPGVHEIKPKQPPAVAGWVEKPLAEKRLLAELGRVLHPEGEPGHVLLVEDDADLAEIVLSSFAQDAAAGDVRVAHARSLAEAQSACRALEPDLIILDLMLPDGTGFALVNWLRGQRDLRTLPLVVYSGRDLSPEERQQLRLGPTEFLDKARVSPQEVEQLVLAMVRHLRSNLAA